MQSNSSPRHMPFNEPILPEMGDGDFNVRSEGIPNTPNINLLQDVWSSQNFGLYQDMDHMQSMDSFSFAVPEQALQLSVGCDGTETENSTDADTVSKFIDFSLTANNLSTSSPPSLNQAHNFVIPENSAVAGPTTNLKTGSQPPYFSNRQIQDSSGEFPLAQIEVTDSTPAVSSEVCHNMTILPQRPKITMAEDKQNMFIPDSFNWDEAAEMVRNILLAQRSMHPSEKARKYWNDEVTQAREIEKILTEKHSLLHKPKSETKMFCEICAQRKPYEENCQYYSKGNSTSHSANHNECRACSGYHTYRTIQKLLHRGGSYCCRCGCYDSVATNPHLEFMRNDKFCCGHGMNANGASTCTHIESSCCDVTAIHKCIHVRLIGTCCCKHGTSCPIYADLYPLLSLNEVQRKEADYRARLRKMPKT